MRNAILIMALAAPAAAALDDGGAAAPPTVVGAPAAAPPDANMAPYEVDMKASEMLFEGDTAVGTFHGSFRKYAVKAAIDPKDLTRSQVLVTIDAESAHANSFLVPDSSLRKRLKSKEFPTETLKAVSIRPGAQAGSYDIVAELSFRGEISMETLTVCIDCLELGVLKLTGSFEKMIDGRKGRVRFTLVLRKAA